MEDNSSQIVEIFNAILQKGLEYKASDIHIEPSEHQIKVRYRVDGKLLELGSLDSQFMESLVSRIKIVADLDIAEKRIPQDGRISLNMNGQAYNFRVATLPTLYGENVVIRILDQSSISNDVNTLGFSENVLSQLKESYNRSNGIVFVTGPTGSGKTTTLYSILNDLNNPDTNIISIEDPIEYELPGITQSQVNEAAGMSFAKGLKAMLRLDPDILMIGEIRDAETAKIAIEAAMTGHIVLSTLHTNDSTSAPTRLIEMGIEPFLISNSIRTILAQRLVRKLCPHCKTTSIMSKIEKEHILAHRPPLMKQTNNPELIELWNTIESDQDITICKKVGCSECNNLGYKGRLGVYELFFITPELSKMIIGKATAEIIREEAYKNGMKTLLESGIINALQGKTTIEEAFRVIL